VLIGGMVEVPAAALSVSQFVETEVPVDPEPMT
jgi:phosphoenolpyruvate-protein kinase (PTS system EI component)